MSATSRRLPWLVRSVLLLAVAGLPVGAMAQAPAPQQGAVRSAQEIDKDIQQARQELGDAIPGMEALLDPTKRAALAGKALPPMRKMVRLLNELGQSEPAAKGAISQAVMELRAMMAVLGDVESNDYLVGLTVGQNAGDATAAKAWLMLVRWVNNRADPAMQEKALEEYIALAKTDPQNPMLVQVASLMAESASTALLSQRIEQTVGNTLTSPMARALAVELSSRRKLAAVENQPLVIEGVKVDGTKFSTADWKGKVILVDFWATWCPPCRAELPELKKFYAAHHEKGLEIIGVSSDREAGDLKTFLAENPDMPWPHLFDPKAGGWHPLCEKFGITGIPTVFIIDRNGVCRTVQGREKYKELIPKLLEEKAK